MQSRGVPAMKPASIILSETSDATSLIVPPSAHFILIRETHATYFIFWMDNKRAKQR